MTPVAPSPVLRPPVLHRLGEDGLLVEFSDHLTMQANASAIAFRDAVRALNLTGASEVGSALKSTFLRFDPVILSHRDAEAALRDLINSRDWADAPLPETRHWRLPACFEGDHAPQLAEFAALADTAPDRLVEELCATPLRVLALGFAPGQPYLGELPARWNVARQTGLTPRVPIGAITAAIRQIVLFAIPSATGWRQIGQAAWRGFDAEAADAAALTAGLTAGDMLRFDPVDAQGFAAHLAVGGGLIQDGRP